MILVESQLKAVFKEVNTAMLVEMTIKNLKTEHSVVIYLCPVIVLCRSNYGEW